MVNVQQAVAAAENYAADALGAADLLLERYNPMRIHKCARTMLGEGEAARSWAGGELEELIHAGGPKYIERIGQNNRIDHRWETS